MEIREIRQRRANLVSQARALVDTADGAQRAMTQEEENQYNALMSQVSQLASDIQRRETLEATERELQQPANDSHRPDPGGTSNPPVEGRASEAYRGAFGTFLRGLSLKQAEMRALQADADTLGGFLVTPMQFVSEMLQVVDNQVYVRQWARKFSVPNADSLGVPSFDTDVADPTWTTELATGTEDSSMAFGRRALHPHPVAKSIKISRELLRKVPDVESLVRERLAYKFGVVQETAFLTGSGAGQPLGVFTASNDGIPTTRDVSTGNTQTALTFDGLIEAKYALKGQYLPRAKWLFHNDAMKMLAKIKDGEGQYIWRGSPVTGEPDRLLGVPYFTSEYVPNTFTSGLYVGILGDWGNGYWIADAYDVEIQRLVELYAATNQIGLIGRMACDGMPVLAEAFVRVKLA